jgi:membrane-bound metal-dependent hydrolase YbcI (DUF457 family)
MPTPLGHAIAGVAAGWLVAPPAIDRRRRVIQAALFAGLAMTPDLDLLVGRHSGETHSIGAAAIAAGIVAWLRWPIARGRARIFLAAWLAWSTHPLLDALSPDTSPPIGVMAFWPLSHAYVQTGWAILEPIWRFPVTVRMIRHDVFATLREIAILLPVLAAMWMWRRRRLDQARAFGSAGTDAL